MAGDAEREAQVVEAEHDLVDPGHADCR